MVNAAEADGVTLRGNGYRSVQRQIELRIAHCGGNSEYNIYERPSRECDPPTAPPGLSNHGTALAIDFVMTPGARTTRVGDPQYDWLVVNASRFGISKLSSEAWHWSHDGR